MNTNIASFDSKEEWYFSLWLDEIEKQGFIERFVYHPKPFVLSDKIEVSFIKKLKTKEKTEFSVILDDHQYQADWFIHWTVKGRGLLWELIDKCKESPKHYPFLAQYSERKGCYSVIDVKGTFNQNDAWRRFSIDQKWIFQKYNIYVQKVIPVPQIYKGHIRPKSALFLTTFTPVRYLLTDGARKDRIIKFPHNTIQQFISQLNSTKNIDNDS